MSTSIPWLRNRRLWHICDINAARSFTKPPSNRATISDMDSTKLDRLLTRVTCRITAIARLRDTGALSERHAEQKLKQATQFRAKLMKQIDAQNFVFDA
jgi:hypothetical protein